MLALVYIDRLIQRNNLLLSSLNVHRCVLGPAARSCLQFGAAVLVNAEGLF